MKNILFLILINFLYSQKLSTLDIGLINLESSLETAQRSSQRVFVEDFTGLN
jgi:hypothetical protein